MRDTHDAKLPTPPATPLDSSSDAFGIREFVGDLSSTTWRILVPVVLFSTGGIVADRKLSSDPWLTLLGLVVGFGFAVLLVRKQLAQVKKVKT